MSNRDPAKRVPKSLGTETKLLGSYTLTDLAVGLFPGVCVVLALQVLVPSSARVAGYRLQVATLPLAGAAILGGLLFVYLTPAYTTSLDWVGTFLGFHARARDHDHEAAREYTRVERVHPEVGAIERADGAFLGVVQVVPPTMALATNKEWTQAAASFEEFLNTTVEFPIQLYSTTRRFPAEEYLDRYEDRFEDPDVKDNPKLEALLEHYTEWYADDLRRRPMTIRDHYVIVPVRRHEVQFDAGSIVEQLGALPVVGPLVRAWRAPPEPVVTAAMAEALDDRLQRVTMGLRDVEGCHAHRVDAGEAAQLIAEYWAGHSLEYDELDRLLRTRPVVANGGETDA